MSIDLPQIVVESRVDDVIDLGSMVLLTERSLWQAFAYLDLPLTNWIARKEISSAEGPIVHLYLEGDGGSNGTLADDLHDALIETMDDYRTSFGITQRQSGAGHASRGRHIHSLYGTKRAGRRGARPSEAATHAAERRRSWLAAGARAGPLETATREP